MLGIQEGRLHRIRDLKDELPGHGCVYRGRAADGTGETTAIFFDKARVTKPDSGHLWLSDTPHRPGSITWGNKFPRMLTRVTFVDKRTGKRFAHINTHFDHVSAHSRRRSATMARARMTAFGLPGVITGDFNTTADTAPHATLVDGRFHDAWNHRAARITPAYRTTNGQHPKPRRTDHRIDWIIATGGGSVRKVGVNTWVPDSRLTPSDHWRRGRWWRSAEPARCRGRPVPAPGDRRRFAGTMDRPPERSPVPCRGPVESGLHSPFTEAIVRQ